MDQDDRALGAGVIGAAEAKAIALQLVVNPTSPIPLWYQIHQQILQTVQDGGLVEGDRLPSMAVLARQARVSFPTIWRAVDELVQRGVLHRRPRLTVARALPADPHTLSA